MSPENPFPCPPDIKLNPICGNWLIIWVYSDSRYLYQKIGGNTNLVFDLLIFILPFFRYPNKEPGN